MKIYFDVWEDNDCFIQTNPKHLEFDDVVIASFSSWDEFVFWFDSCVSDDPRLGGVVEVTIGEE